ncbi:DUF4381 domain-containing protein [Sulfurovum sp. CS9]|uniref:DUF4381 domain-containing protein n=1 Tax=Sulfurovum sp. CS9 TaxID=3391146 RepID=UPI0039E8DB9B
MESNVTVNASLDQLHDIIIPPAVSYWPLAPGWYALALLVLTYGIYVGLKYWSTYQKNLYRREALKVLSGMKLGEDTSKEISTLLGLMKRVGLQHFGREKVAALSDDAWWDFMEKHSKTKVDVEVRELSQKILYSPYAEATTEDVKLISKVAKVWITTHKGEADA